MYNFHNDAVSIEFILRSKGLADFHYADAIEKNPLGYIEYALNEEYKKSAEKKILINQFDDRYTKYKGKKLTDWESQDSSQMVKDLRKILD